MELRKQQRPFGLSYFPNTALVLLLAACSIGTAEGAAGSGVSNRSTVIVLVDESGTLRVDRHGWRREAISLLAHTLPNGSSMAVSGFGNPGRKLDLRLLSMEGVEAGRSNRARIADKAAQLSNSDDRTDLFGALQQALQVLKATNAALLESAPPAIVILSDFRPDPQPDSALSDGVCRSIRDGGIDLIAVGVGDVDVATQSRLAACANTAPLGSVSDPASLLDAFWQVQRRLTQSVRIYDQQFDSEGVAKIPAPSWANELVLMAWSISRPAETWNIETSNAIIAATGSNHRATIVRLSDRDRSAGSKDVVLRNASGVRLSAAARGDLLLRLEAANPQPWLLREVLHLHAQLVSARTNKTATEWLAFGRSTYSAWAQVGGSAPVPVTLAADSGKFAASLLAPAGGTQVARSTVNIDGAVWDAQFTALVEPSPIRLDGQGTLTAQAWIPGQPLSIRIETALGNRAFKVDVQPAEALGGRSQQATFDAGNREQTVELTTGGGSLNILDWFRPHRPLASWLDMRTRLENGQVIALGQPVPLVIRFQPLWLRLLLAFVPVLAAIGALRGRRLPGWHLVRCDENGRPIPSEEPVRLRAFRRHLRLHRFGLPGASIRTALISGKTHILLNGSTTHRPGGHQELANRAGRYQLHVEDILSSVRQDGSTISYRIEAF